MLTVMSVNVGSELNDFILQPLYLPSVFDRNTVSIYGITVREY